ncbi:MAG: hypothetical protein OEV66_10110 [Spirochaetia bacterium]|nr:hypothetical protein [Spirochaetia bacterium]
MKKKILLILFASTFAWGNLSSEEQPAGDAGKKLSYNLALDFGTTYLWRMNDTYAPALKDQTSLFPFAPGIFPSVTINAGSEWAFNIWGARSLLYRDVQQGELKSYDEVDFTGTYTVKDNSGTFAGSLIGYVFPTTGSAGLTPSYAEMVFGYTAPFELLNPSITIAAAMAPASALATEYANISISHEFAAGILKFTPKILFGYWYYNADSALNKGHVDVMLPVSVAINDKFEVHAMIDGCWRTFGFDPKYAPFILVGTLGASFTF